MDMSKYVRITKGVKDRGELVPVDEFDKDFASDEDFYISTYYYTSEHFQKFKETGSVKGIRGLKTNKIWFDFDKAGQVEQAQADARTVVERLKSAGISENNIDIYFSGNKGFTVEVTFDKELNRTQVEHLTLKKFGHGLETLDPSLYDDNQILRLPNTKHPESGLYKVQLTPKQLNLSLSKIKEFATETKKLKEKAPANISEELIKVPEIEKKERVKTNLPTNLKERPTHWKEYKWALLNGVGILSGERSSAMAVIAATCRGLGYNRDLTEMMLNYFDEKYVEATGQAPDADGENHIENKLNSVFSPTWNGGQFSYKNNPWLQKYCERNGLEVDLRQEATDTIGVDEAFDMFKDYAVNIDALTIKTGIPQLDDLLTMTVGMSVGVVAAPGVGKTSLALQILNNVSNEGIPAIFFSYDMFHALVYQKLIQKHCGLNEKEIFGIFKGKDIARQEKIRQTIKDQYKNVEFCFTAGQSVEDIQTTIKAVEQKIGRKVKLIIMDYNELVATEQSDATAASSYVAQKLREIANVEQLCCISLFQPNKLSGSPSDALRSYRAAKGSSAIEQSVGIMLGMYRPGYDPEKNHDNFLTISCLKNRMGQTFSLDLHWDGLTGSVRELHEHEEEELRKIRETKKTEELTPAGFGR